jgi:hypothetical protein
MKGLGQYAYTATQLYHGHEDVLNETITYLSIYGSTVLLLDLGRFFSFSDLYKSVRFLGRGISRSQGLYLPAGEHKQNKRTQTSMPRVGFEPRIPAFERAKTVRASDLAATVIGTKPLYRKEILQLDKTRK